MDLWSRMMLPWMSIRMPASGDVFMSYNPWTNWGWSTRDAGDPDVENEIFANVALPGKQLGKLTEAVMTLIELAEKDHPELGEPESERALAIGELKELANKIEARKKEIRGTEEGQAERALHRLKSLDRQAFNRIVEREYSELRDQQ